MRSIRLYRLGIQTIASRTPLLQCLSTANPRHDLPPLEPHNHRQKSSKKAPKAAKASKASNASSPTPSTLTLTPQPDPASPPLETLPSPPPFRARTSAKLAALHARLSLPSQLPLETLARTLVDPTADGSPWFNNHALATLGGDLLGCYTAEHLLCTYPRLPMAVLHAAMYAYVGPAALAAITREWGVELAAFPGGELDPGLLQLRRVPPGTPPPSSSPASPPATPEHGSGYVRKLGVSARIVFDNQFGGKGQTSWGPALKPAGDLAGGSKGRLIGSTGEKHATLDVPGTTIEEASKGFVRAVMGAVYLHGGRTAAKSFFASHFLTRRLDMSLLFDFQWATRDLSRLCAREGFESPIARLLSETGRLSRHPVFVVGVFSGRDKLGEGAGASIEEARVRASAAALKGWYLYSPLTHMVPSDMEGASPETRKKWKPQMIDIGEIIP